VEWYETGNGRKLIIGGRRIIQQERTVDRTEGRGI
jgi:hypothetical protein